MYIKTVQVKITKCQVWAAPRTVDFSVKISCRWERGFTANENVKEG